MLSFVIPAYNEAEGIKAFHKTLLLPNIKKLGEEEYEIIYVNDGSKDTTLNLLTGFAHKDKHIKVINLSRNFGKEIATTAGIFESSGDATIILDADGQHPPELFKEFINKWKAGAQVVVGVRNKEQHEGFIKRAGSKIFYKAFNSASGVEMIPRSTDFRLIDSDVREEFKKFKENNRITRGLIDWLGFQRDYVYFDSPARLAGKASYKTGQLVKLAINSFTSLSLKPLFMFGWVGVGITTLSILFGLFIIIEQFILNDPLALHFSGPVILGVFTSFMIGLVLISQAILAVYISHIHAHSQNRPLFVIDQSKSSNLR